MIVLKIKDDKLQETINISNLKSVGQMSYYEQLNTI